MDKEKIKVIALEEAVSAAADNGEPIIKLADKFYEFLTKDDPVKAALEKTVKELTAILEEADLETFTDRGGTLRLKGGYFSGDESEE